MVNILIVEDQWLLSSAVEEAVLSLGHEAIGTATTAKEAYELADKAEVAFVDVNLIEVRPDRKSVFRHGIRALTHF